MSNVVVRATKAYCRNVHVEQAVQWVAILVTSILSLMTMILYFTEHVESPSPELIQAVSAFGNWYPIVLLGALFGAPALRALWNRRRGETDG